jgi:hypothetical protein
MWSLNNEPDMGVHVDNPGYLGGRGKKITVWNWSGQKHETLSENQKKSKRVGGMAQVVEHLPSKYKAPSSIHNSESEEREMLFLKFRHVGTDSDSSNGTKIENMHREEQWGSKGMI